MVEFIDNGRTGESKSGVSGLSRLTFEIDRIEVSVIDCCSSKNNVLQLQLAVSRKRIHLRTPFTEIRMLPIP